MAVGSPPDQIWLTNNLPYAQKLEGGSSTHAPGGILAPSIDAVVAAFRGSFE